MIGRFLTAAQGTAEFQKLTDMTSVNHSYQRPKDLHPAEIGPALPGDPMTNEHGFFNNYSWNSA